MRSNESLVSALPLEQARALAVSWADGTEARFHAIWLRDNSPDSATRDPINGQKRITVLDIPAESSVASAEIRDPNTLAVRFAPDGHETQFSGGWLYENRYDRDLRRPRGAAAAGIETWDGDLERCLPAAQWQTASRDSSALHAWLAAIRRYGFALMTGVPVERGAIENVVGLFGFIRETSYGRCFDVRAEISPSNLAYTALGLQVHTDNPYCHSVPTLQLLYCLSSDAAGGDSTVVDGFRAAEILREEAEEDFALLTGNSVPFEYRGRGEVHLCATGPLIRLSPEGELTAVRFNNRSAAPFRLPYEVMAAYYGAYRRFAAILERPVLRVSFKLAPGDLFIVDNERVLHGRTAYSSAGTRHLVGCYADKDALYSTLSILESRLGEAAE